MLTQKLKQDAKAERRRKAILEARDVTEPQDATELETDAGEPDRVIPPETPEITHS